MSDPDSSATVWTLGKDKRRLRRLGGMEGKIGLGEVDLSFGFDDEEGVGVGVAGVAELLAGVVEGVGEDGEDDAAVGAADEVEAALLVDGLELRRHARTATRRCTRSRGILRSGDSAQDDSARECAIGSIHRIGWRIN